MPNITKPRLTLPQTGQIAADREPAVELANISTAFHEDFCIHDLPLAKRPAFKLAYDIRELIKQNADALRICGSVARQNITHTGQIRGTCPSGTRKLSGRTGGRLKHYWLNEGQARLLCSLAHTTTAARIHRALIAVFMAHRVGTLSPAVYWCGKWGRSKRCMPPAEKMRPELTRFAGTLALFPARSMIRANLCRLPVKTPPPALHGLCCRWPHIAACGYPLRA